MNIDSIQYGFVIDHIPAGKGMKLYELLGLDALDCSIALIRNVGSDKLGKKDMIKIDADIEINFDIIGFIAPEVTVNIIKDGNIVEKMKMELPPELSGVICCKNPRCITSVEREIVHEFKLTDREKKVYRCIYCEAKKN